MGRALGKECLQGGTQRWLGAGELGGKSKERHRLVARQAQPALQGADPQIASFAMAQPECIDDAAFGTVEADGQVPGQIERFAAKIESGGVETVPDRRRPSRGSPLPARHGDIDARRDLVGQSVPGQSADESQGGLGGPDRDLDQVDVSVLVAVVSPEQAVLELFDLSVVAKLVEAPL